MKQFKWTPRADSEFEGHVMIAIPKHIERLELMKKLKMKVNKDGVLEENTDLIEKQQIMMEAAEAHVKEVKLTHKPSGAKLKSFEDLSYSQECYLLLNEIANVVLMGIKLGEQQGVSSDSK